MIFRVTFLGPAAGGPALTFAAELRPRWFPWGTDNTTLTTRTVWAKHYPALVAGFVLSQSQAARGGTLSPADAKRAREAVATLQHEFTHVYQTIQHGHLWHLLHPRRREAEAHANEQRGAFIVIEALP